MAKPLTEEARAFLADVPEEFVFRLADGGVLRNLTDLSQALGAMTDETFVHHVNAEKNDFGRWIRDVIKDEWLAKSLEKTGSRADATKKVDNRIAILSRRLS